MSIQQQESLQKFVDELFKVRFSGIVQSSIQNSSTRSEINSVRALFYEKLARALGGMRSPAAYDLYGTQGKRVRQLSALILAQYDTSDMHRTQTFKQFEAELNKFFLESHIPASNVQKKNIFSLLAHNIRRPKSNLAVKYLYIPIAQAIQETIFSIPGYLYSGIDPVPKEVIENLNKQLQFIHTLALPKPILSLNAAQVRLYREIAKVDGFLFFPLRKLPTAALKDQDELDLLCVGRTDLIKRLALRVVKNDGVMLIAGYRGVGKSTFVNAVLKELDAIASQQSEEQQWHIIPIYISLAKIGTVMSVLRLCIRKLYYTFLVEEPTEIQSRTKLLGKAKHRDLEKLLDKEEKNLLKWVNLHALHKVDTTWTESIASLKHLEASLDLKPGDLLPKNIVGGPFGSLLPTLSTKMSKEWNNRVEQSVALLDYDEDRAEEDIVRVIEKFSRPGKNRAYGIKFVFVFDEMDKLEDDAIALLIKQLKNLFLTSNVVFILVTGKEFYYNLLDEKKHEDSLLGSYFSMVKIIPLFTSADTSELLKRLYMSSTPPTLKEESFIKLIAPYLTYKAKGVPREIIRELQEILEWLPESTQPYIADRFKHLDLFQIYADIQDAIEGVMSDLDISDEDKREQIKRGLYILMEELFGSRSMMLTIEQKNSPDKPKQQEELKEPKKDGKEIQEQNAPDEQSLLSLIHKRNFSLISLDEFKRLLEYLQVRLRSVFIKEGSKQPQPLFSVNSSIISVSLDFYRLTGQVVPLTLDSQLTQLLHLETHEIKERLTQDNLFGWKEVFLALRQSSSVVTELYPELYAIFILKQGTTSFTPDQVTEFRHAAASYLISANVFFTLVAQNRPDTFLEKESNETLIQDFIQLMPQANTSQERELAVTMMFMLLKRHQLKNPQKGVSSAALLNLSKGVFMNLVSTLCLATEVDITDQVLGSLDLEQDISDLLPALQSLAKRFHHRLIDKLIEHDLKQIQPEAIRNLLIDVISSDNALEEVWQLALQYKQRSIAQKVIAQIAQQWITDNQGQTPMILWLNMQKHDATIDKQILSEIVTEQTRSYFTSLLQNSLMSDEGCLFLREVLKEEEPPTQPLLASNLYQSPTSGLSWDSLKGWVVAASMIALLATYFIVSFDLPLHLDIWGRIWRRLAEMALIYGGVFGVFLLSMGISDGEDDLRIVGIVLLIIAVACLLLLLFVIPLALTFWGQVYLMGLLIAILLPLLLVADDVY